jgi:hypothetical protein
MRMLAAYGIDTSRVLAISEFEDRAKSGAIFVVYVSSVSQSGWLDGSHLHRPAAWRRCVAATRALDSRDFEATRPRRAASSIRSLETATAQ